MLRTRDFLLVFSIVSFLVFAIGGTLIMRYFEGRESSVTTIPTFVPVEITTDYTAEVSATDTLVRDERLAEMRAKIAARGELISAPAAEQPAVDDNIAAGTATTTTEATTVIAKQCVGYGAYSGTWDAAQLSVETVEGARVVRNTLTDTIELTLPVRFGKSGAYCLPTDVIGIALDGSLIRNGEVGLYGVFGSETVIGYALDGFPIYGSSSITSDECGGTAVVGGYAYYLNTERDSILGCFAAPPITLL